MDDASKTTTRKATRSSLACLPCRSRHLKCDGARPCCARCAEAGDECNYTQSRRGGLDRAALAERRKRLAAAEGLSSIGTAAAPATGASPRETRTAWPRDGADAGTNGFLSNGLLSGAIRPHPEHAGVSPPQPPVQFDSVEGDALIGTFYRTFHRFHPFVLPHRHLASLYRQSPVTQTRLQPLIAVIRLVGRLYASRELSQPLRDAVEASFATADETDPFMVQSRLLYSVLLFWHSFRAEAKREMDAAARSAMDAGMFRREFAGEHGMGDPVLVESWRRTWWTLYIVDAYYAGTLGTMNMAVVDVDATTELPCEEAEYETGNIPEPRTLDDFDCREFAPDDAPFSSFAYLIGAVRCAASAIMSTPRAPIQDASVHVVQAADSALGAWMLLLPKGEKSVMTRSGEIDELMLQAHLLIHVSTIGLHRPLSDLKFNAVEDVSSCAREPPLDNPTPDLVNVHTVRVLRAVEAQIRLLTLATSNTGSSATSSSPSTMLPFSHTPFTTCMVSEGTLALLSACKFLLQGRELAVARDQIRMTVGCLRQLGELWPRAARNVQEIQMIARHVLGLGSSSSSSKAGSSSSSSINGSRSLLSVEGSAALPVPSLSGGEDGSSSGLSSVEVGGDMFSGEGLDTICGWYNWTDLGTDYSWLLTPES